MKIAVANPEEVVKEAFWLAWQACGSPMGMGVFKNNPGATKEEVWSNVRRAGDYGDGRGSAAKIMHSDRPGEAHGDYVFGRMMKLSLQWDKESIELRDSTPRPDYQSWCRKYPTYQSLVEAAAESINKPENRP